MESGNQGYLVVIGAGELLAIGLGGKRRKLNLGYLAVFKDIDQIAAEITGQQHEDGCFALVHAQLLGQIVTQHAGLGIIKLVELGLVSLALVGEEDDLSLVGGFKGLAQTVAFLELLLAADTERLGHDLLEITVLGQEDADGIVLDVLALVIFLHLVLINDSGAALGGVLFDNGFQFLDDQIAQLGLAGQDVLQTVDLVFQILHFLEALEDVLLVDVAQLDLGDELGLHLVNAKADHQIGDDLGVLFGVSDNGDGPVDIQQDLAQTLQQV